MAHDGSSRRTDHEVTKLQRGVINSIAYLIWIENTNSSYPRSNKQSTGFPEVLARAMVLLIEGLIHGWHRLHYSPSSFG